MDNLEIDIETIQEIEVEIGEVLMVQNNDHSKLIKLTYEDSGHTGFASSIDLDAKVDKEDGKGLSSNDFTNDYKQKVDNFSSGSVTSVNGETGDVVLDIPTALSELSDDSTHRLVSDTEKNTWNNKLSSETDPVFISSPANNITNDHITVLNNTSGSNTGDETQESIKTKLGSASASTDGYLTSTDWNTFNGKQSALGYTPEDVSNKVTSISVSSTDIQYPSAKCVFDIVGDISATLDAISGEVI
jgi:hypothetical protein